jgi:hypothetical protein
VNFKVGDIVWSNRDGLDIAEIVAVGVRDYTLKSLTYYRGMKPGQIDGSRIGNIDRFYKILTLEDRAKFL